MTMTSPDRSGDTSLDTRWTPPGKGDGRNSGNGDLLNVAEREGYEVFITADQKIPYQQNIAPRPFGVVVLLSNNWSQVRENTTAVQSALEGIQPGELREVPIPQV